MKVGVDYIGIMTPFYCHDAEGRLLLGKRSKNCRDEHGRWDASSGQLELGLSIRENLLKEIKEEYGCSGEIIEILPAHDIFREQNGKQTHWLAVPAFVRVNHTEVVITEPDKIEEIGWFTLETLPEPLHTGFKQTLERYRQFFEKYIKTQLI